MFRKNTREKGNDGEEVACCYLENLGFTVIERNYLKKWGEIDVIAIKSGILHFIEVKSVAGGEYRPEENVSGLKIKRLKRVIQTYLAENYRKEEIPFEFHVVAINFDRFSGKPEVRLLENIIL
ncbi:MAG: YraN family protein [Patescibacteria group bacterium]